MEGNMKDLVLGIDCSTTASKVVAWDREGKPVGEGRADLEEIRPGPQYSEQRADGWLDATAGAIADLTQSVEADRFAGVCITHQRESFVPVDERNRPQYNAILWDDARSLQQLEELGERYGHDELRRRTGRGAVDHPGVLQAAVAGGARARHRQARLQVHGRARLPGAAAHR
jgi:xylulokinase